jgi:hypothetical protein
MPMRNSSTATADSCVFCAPGSAGSSATSGGTLRVRCEGFHRHHQCARSQATRTSGRHSLGHSRGPIRSARSSSASAAGSFIPSTLRKWNASARARPADRGHNAAKPRRVFISGQKRGVFGHQTRAQTSLRHRGGDRTNESKAISAAAISKVAPAMPPTFILSAVGYNLRLVLAWLRMIFARHPLALLQTSRFGSTNWIFNGRRTRTASFSCPLWPRQANDDS